MAEFKYSHKKALESQRKIYKGLRRLLEKKPLIEISVTDISEECQISRTTFYRNFSNINDILYITFDYYYDRYLHSRINKDNQLLFFFEYWQYHKDLTHILSEQIPSILYEIIEKYSNIDNTNILNLKVDLFSSIISKWSKHKTGTPENLEKMTKDILTKKAIELLLK